MTDTLVPLLAAAKAGDPVYITDVRRRFAGLPPAKSFAVDVALHCLKNGEVRVFPLRLPLTADEEKRNFADEYFLAEIYNMLSSLGGRAVALHSENKPEADRLAALFAKSFGIGLPTVKRTAYGNCLNVIDRMLPALPGGAGSGFTISATDSPAPAESIATAKSGGAAELFRRSAEDLAGKAILGIDIGGTDIKLALAADGRLACCKEFDWYPAGFETVEEFVGPVTTLVELMAWAARARTKKDAGLDEILAPALDRKADVPTMTAAIAAAAEKFGDCGILFDGIGMSFPDVVVGNKIVGGETLKTRGMRNHWGDNYDAEFSKLTHLDDTLRKYVKPDGAVGIVNDGPMAAFTAGVESAVANPEGVKDGVFAHTLGTELGSGWVTETGDFPDIPLEVYNFVIDLGSYPERIHEPDDVRSVNNFNTRLAGTLQKYTSQSGVFRLAFKLLPKVRPDVIQEISRRGFVVEGPGGQLIVPTSPRDMRKPFLEYMMELADSDADPAIARIFEEIGRALAVTGLETDRLLRPACRRRTLFGRLVKRPRCFELMRKGATGYDAGADLAVADEGIAETSLMRELGESREYTVAQFAQAVGAVYFANAKLAEIEKR